MKLTNSQINALAEKIVDEYYKEVITPIIEYNNGIINSNAYSNFIANNKLCQELESYRKIANGTVDSMQRYIRQIAFESEFKPVPMRLRSDTIRNEIILATIEIDNLDDLITKIKQLFWK